MAKACEICGKGSLTRTNKRHTARGKFFSNVGQHGLKGKRVSYIFHPNFREVRLTKGSQKVTTCMRCYKSLKDSINLTAAVAK